MSSTNRLNAAARHVADYYVTPVASIKEFLDAFREDFPAFANESKLRGWDLIDPCGETPFTILDPCAGGDAKHEMSYPAAIERYSQWNFNGIDTVDIRPDSRAEFREDYLFKDFGHGPYDMAITNPPFNIALDVIQKCMKEVHGGGLVIMLLRLNFFGSQERSNWFKHFMPLATYVHSRRMKFTNTGGTDSIEYMHAVWCVGHHPKHTLLRIL